MSRNSSLAAFACLVLGCSAVGDHQPPALIGQAEGALVDTGPDEDSPRRRATVVLQQLPEGRQGCTAVVITPTRVLTAAHCIEGVGSAPFRDGWLTTAAPYVAKVWDQSTGTEVAKQTSRTAYMATAKIGNAALGPQDLAVLTFTTPLSIQGGLIPAHPTEPAAGLTCTLGSAKHLYVGYGETALGLAGFVRKKAFEDVTCGDQCQRDLPPFGQPGDSGGPLFRTQGAVDNKDVLHVVCGVASWIGQFDADKPSLAGPIRWARPGNPTNVPFIDATAKGYSGLWAGEFPAPGPGLPDSDGDGVPDTWDNCPAAANATQVDDDSDGRGDACDNCTRHANFDQDNSNSQDEATGPGALGDLCDPKPLTKISVTGHRAVTDGILPRQVACTIRTPETGCADAPSTCSVSRGNRLSVTSFFAGTSTVTDEQRAGLVAIRVCKCPADDPQFCRTNPDFHCARDGDVSFDRRNPGGDWVSPDLRRLGGSYALEDSPYGRFWLRTTHNNLVKGLAPSVSDVYWDYRTNGLAPALPTATEPSREVFAGIAWAWVKNERKLGTPAPAASDAADPGEKTRQTITRLSVSEVYPAGVQRSPLCMVRKIVPVPRVPTFRPDWGGWQPPPCTSCGWGARSFAVRFVYPSGESPSAIAAGFEADDVDVTASFDSPVLLAMSGDANTTVLAGDPPGPGTGDFVGAQIELSTHRVVAKLRMSGNRLVADAVSIGSGGGPLITATSGRRQEVAFIGERDGAGAVLQQIRAFNLASGVVASRPLNVDEYALVDPVAATYSAFDDSYYVIDRFAGGTRIRLLRIPITNVVHLVGEWSRSSAFPSVALTATPRGHIVVSAWNASAHHVAVVSLDGEGIQLLQLHSGSAALSEPAFGGLDGVFFSRLSGGEPQPLERLPEAWLADRLDPDVLNQVF